MEVAMELAVSQDRCEVNWIVENPAADPVRGNVGWDAGHSMWNGGMLLGAP
jgi:sn-1 stearoyl-lipid 9-desaturase